MRKLLEEMERLSKLQEGYSILPNIDRERYTEIPDLEGPFMLRSGKVVYYDPSEGKYYDRDTDMYVSDEEYFAHSENNFDKGVSRLKKLAGINDESGSDGSEV